MAAWVNLAAWALKVGCLLINSIYVSEKCDSNRWSPFVWPILFIYFHLQSGVCTHGVEPWVGRHHEPTHQTNGEIGGVKIYNGRNGGNFVSREYICIYVSMNRWRTRLRGYTTLSDQTSSWWKYLLLKIVRISGGYSLTKGNREIYVATGNFFFNNQRLYMLDASF